ncbi:nucleotidyltransferase domain-containing protein [Candidatus Bathyarchaeota archaeon]|nr:nucleotidyltransferase domain-containing protein [Candidatus Bathyarchaeota archaeon]
MNEPYRTLVQKLLQELLKVFGDSLVSFVIYGSVARGKAEKDSDLDILLVIEHLPKSRFERLNLFSKAEEELEPLLNKLLDEGYGIALSPIMKSKGEALRMSPLYLDMVEDSIIIYDKGEFFKNILQRLKKRLKELGAERVWIGKKWYWRLKKEFKLGEVIIIE